MAPRATADGHAALKFKATGLAPFSVHAFCGHHALKVLQQINHHHLIWTIDFFLLYLNASILGPRLNRRLAPLDYWCGRRA